MDKRLVHVIDGKRPIEEQLSHLTAEELWLTARVWASAAVWSRKHFEGNEKSCEQIQAVCEWLAHQKAHDEPR